MGTGVGEAMLIGAVTGAGTSAITGGDPLKGALLGAVGGGVGSGLGGALAGGGAGAATGAATGATTGAATGATTGAATGATSGAASALPAAASAPVSMVPTATVPSAFNTAMAGPAAGSVPVGSFGNVGMTSGGFGNTIGTAAAPTTVAGLPSATAAIPPSTVPTAATGAVPKTPMKFMDIFKGENGTFGQRLGTYMVENPTQTAMTSANIANMLGQTPKKLPGEEEYTGPLSRFSYNPDRYRPAFADGGITDLSFTEDYASGGIADLGSYSDGGRLLKGPGDGMSDSIPAKIGRKQPARLADGEFVVPADVVSHLGNGSTDAGAKQLYAMMDKVRRERTGSKKQGKQINPRKYVPA